MAEILIRINYLSIYLSIYLQRCLRQLWFTAALFDFEVRALHVPGKHSQFADCLCCWHSDASACDGFYRLLVTLISFFIFKLSTLRVFLSMLRDHICLFCFDFLFFLDPSAGFAGPPLPADVSVVSLQSLVLRLITLAHATSHRRT